MLSGQLLKSLLVRAIHGADYVMPPIMPPRGYEGIERELRRLRLAVYCVAGALCVVAGGVIGRG